MADFLTSMTQRTLGLLPVVQPIVASKYVSEAIGAAGPGALSLLDHFPGQMADEPFEQWEEPAEQPTLAARPQALSPREVPGPTPAIRGTSPALASSSPLEHPSTAAAQQANARPTTPQAAPSAREAKGGGNPPSPLVPQSQTMPVREESVPPVRRPAADRSAPVRKDALPAADESVEIVSPQPQSGASSENQPFPTASASAPVSTMKPQGGQGKPSARSHQPMDNAPLVPAPSGGIPAIPQLPQVDARVAYKKSVEQQPITPTPAIEESSLESAFPMVAPSSLFPTTGTSNNPPINKRDIARVRPEGVASTLVTEEGQSEPERERPGRGGRKSGEARPLQYTKRAAADPLGVGETEQGEPGRGQARPLQYTKRSAADPYRVGVGPAPLFRPLVSPVLLSEALSGQASPSMASTAGSDLVEPLVPPANTYVQSRRLEAPMAGKRGEAQRSETPAAPTIRVTIGRIDVRAVTPAPPAAPAPMRTQRAMPALSLEDYLKQRNGGQP